MKKYSKYVIPFVVLFFLLPMNSAAFGTYTYGTPVQDWGTEIGDTHYYTLGWAFEVDLGDEAWDMLDYLLDQIDPSLDARTMYLHLSNVESVYNMRMTITNMTSYFYNSSPTYNRSADAITGDMAWKAASMPDYGHLNQTMIYVLQQNALLFNAYSTMFGWGISASELEDQLEIANYSTQFYQEWSNTQEGEVTNRPNGPAMFIPTDWSVEDFYTWLQTQPDVYFYGNFSENFNVTVANWAELTSALGFTTINVNTRDITLKFKLSAMHETLLNDWVNYTLQAEDNGTRIETYAELLDFLNITNFDAELRLDADWNRKGILQNFHVQWDITGRYEDEKFKIAPVFDISYGEHDKINAKFTIPGYSVYLVAMVGIAAISIIILRIKKKKS